MKQERLKVLGLLEEGKITAEDAGLLLDKLAQNEGHHFISEDTAEQVEEKMHRFAKNAEHFAKEFSQKAHTAYKDVEPKLKKVSQTVLEKTAAIVDDIAKTLHDSIESAKLRSEQGEKNCCEGDACCAEKNDDTPRHN